MSKYNIYIVRAMSKKQRKAYLAIAAKYSYKKYLKLNFTFTNNNIFVNLCNGLGESLFKKTFSIIQSCVVLLIYSLPAPGIDMFK